jgi:hypothetical protein
MRLLKQLLLIFFLGHIFAPLTAQFNIDYPVAFNFPVYFEDGAGNKDTVELIYSTEYPNYQPHPTAFETNLVDVPFDSVFEARIGMDRGDLAFLTPGYMGKNIHFAFDPVNDVIGAPYSSMDGYARLFVNVRHLPLKISWKAELFHPDSVLGGMRGGYILNYMLYETVPIPSSYDPHTPGSVFDGGCMVLGEKTFDIDTTLGIDAAAYPGIGSLDYALAHIEGSPYEMDTVSVFTLWITFDFRSICTDLVSVDELSRVAGPEILVYPNPVTDRVKVNSDAAQAGIEQISVYNLAGIKVADYSWSGEGNKVVIDVSDFPSGLYLLRGLLSDGRSFARKIVK